jgi:hypothetical protein
MLLLNNFNSIIIIYILTIFLLKLKNLTKTFFFIIIIISLISSTTSMDLTNPVCAIVLSSAVDWTPVDCSVRLAKLLSNNIRTKLYDIKAKKSNVEQILSSLPSNMRFTRRVLEGYLKYAPCY